MSTELEYSQSATDMLPSWLAGNLVFAEALIKRRAGREPNYVLEHFCPFCESTYLCPDRYYSQSCGPTDYGRELGWKHIQTFTCLPCMLKVSSSERAAWYEAHGIAQ
jgi:hypothetical protein